MGTSFYERDHLPSPSFESTSDLHDNERHRQSSKMSSENTRQKNYRLTKKRGRGSKATEARKSTVKESLEKFLVDSQHEDLQFRKTYIDDRSLDDDEIRQLFRIDDKNDNRRKRSSKKSRSKNRKNPSITDSRRKRSSRRKKNHKPKSKKNDERREEREHQTIPDNPLVGSGTSQQLTMHASLSGLNSKIQSTNLSGSLRSQSLTSGGLKAQTRDQSGLMTGLENLDRQVRRDRMKKEYRGRSVDLRLEDSFSSGISFRSQHTARLYKKSGLEGGALNAYMGNDSIVRQASRGADIMSLSESASSFFSAPASEEYLKERKARQDHILDLARTEKRLQEIKVEEEDKIHEDGGIESILHFSDDETEMRKDGLVDKLKRAASKTAKISKSSVKEAANAVVNSTLRKSYSSIDWDYEEREKFTDDSGPFTNQSMKEKNGSKVAGDLNGGFDAIRSLTKKRSKKTEKETSGHDSRIIPICPKPRDKKKKKKLGSRSMSNSPRTEHRKKKHGSRSGSNSPRIEEGKKKHGSRTVSNSPRIKERKKKHGSRSVSNSPRIRDKKNAELSLNSNSPKVRDKCAVYLKTSDNITLCSSPSEKSFPLLTDPFPLMSRSPRNRNGKTKHGSRSVSNSPRIKDKKNPESRMKSDSPKARDKCAEYLKTNGNISLCNKPSEIPFPILTDPFSFKSDADWWGF